VYGGSRSIAPIILYLGTRRRGVVNFMPQQPYRSRKNSLYLLNNEAGWAAHAVWTVWTIEKSLVPAWLQSRIQKFGMNIRFFVIRDYFSSSVI
jgi:hypothetical protein